MEDKRKDKKLKPFTAWVIKHKKANHPVVSGIFYTKIDALDDFNKMPSYDYNGCGKKDDYEIVKVIVKLSEDLRTKK